MKMKMKMKKRLLKYDVGQDMDTNAVNIRRV